MATSVQTWLDRDFPIVIGGATLEARETQADDGVTITYSIVLRDEAGQLYDLKEQDASYPTLDEATVRTIAQRATERLEECSDPSIVLPYDLVREIHRYERIELPPPHDEREWNEALTDAIRKLALAAGIEESFERLDDWPVEPRTVYFLDLALAMLGGNGCEVFFEQNRAEEIIGIIEACDQAGCERFATLLRVALFVADRQRSGEFLEWIDEQWMHEQMRVPEHPNVSWSELDTHAEGGTYFLLKEEVRPRLADYIAAHRDRLAR